MGKLSEQLENLLCEARTGNHYKIWQHTELLGYENAKNPQEALNKVAKKMGFRSWQDVRRKYPKESSTVKVKKTSGPDPLSWLQEPDYTLIDKLLNPEAREKMKKRHEKEREKAFRKLSPWEY